MVVHAIRATRELASEMYCETGREYYEKVAELGERRRRPGPRSSLTPELLTDTVVPAFKTGGRKVVVAVRDAMQAAGHPRSGPRGEVTIGQARKAVQRARALDLLPRPRRTVRKDQQS